MSAALLLLLAEAPVGRGAAPASDPELAAGIALVREGDFEAAILKLDAVARRLETDRARVQEAAQGYLYLGVAYLELDQELVARSKFQTACRLDPRLTLEPHQFSAQQIRVFDSACRDSRPAAAVTQPGNGAPTAAAASQKKKRSAVPWLIGGAAVVGGGVAAAGGGGGGGSAQTTTTTQSSGVTSTTLGGSTTTTMGEPTTTTVPGEPTTTTTAPISPTTTTPATTTTLPGTTTTTTTLPGTTTTSTTTATTTTTTTTTTTPPACAYSMSPPSQNVGSGAGSGTCLIDTSLQSCPWTAESMDTSWLTIDGSASGTGDGSVTFRVSSNLLGCARSARIRLQQDPGTSCAVSQAGGLICSADQTRDFAWTSHLDLAGGRAQVVVDGNSASFHGPGSHQGWLQREGTHRLEGTIVNADGQPGTWRFQLSGPLAPGSLRVIAGTAVGRAEDAVVFRLAGRPGERVVFTFRTR